MEPTAVITGLGLATPLGNSLHSTWQSLLAGHFITDHSQVPGITADDRLRDLALRVARQATHEARWTPDLLADPETALIVGTSKGSIVSWLTPLLHMAGTPYVAGGVNPAGLSQVAHNLANDLTFGPGPRLTLSAACASGLLALIRATLLLRSNQARRVLVVACESSVHPLFLGSFKRLGVLATPGQGCRPFDLNRDGFLMTEAAAAVCLELKTTPKDAIYPAVSRFALGGDATHLIAGDPQAATLSRLLTQTIADQSIDLIHAHATGTLSNDPTELAALESSLSSAQPAASLYSHKGVLGHSLGAAGLISIVLNCMMHRTATVLPNIQTVSPLPMHRLTLSRGLDRREIRRSLAIAAGFGGPTAVVSLQSI